MEVRKKSNATKAAPTQSTHPDWGLRRYIDNLVEGLLKRPGMWTGGSEPVEESLWMTLIQLEALALPNEGWKEAWREATSKARYDLRVRVPSPMPLAYRGDNKLPAGVTMADVYLYALEDIRSQVRGLTHPPLVEASHEANPNDP